jgi:hypothetical protein
MEKAEIIYIDYRKDLEPESINKKKPDSRSFDLAQDRFRENNKI